MGSSVGSPTSTQPSGIHTFDLDVYLNPLVPRPRLHCLPTSISHFFGYRPPTEDSKSPTSPLSRPSNLYVWIFAFVGGFIGIAIIENVYRALPSLDNHQIPLIIASFGAAAILEYNTIESPLAQPRNLLVGHLISAILGVGITKLFHLLPPDRFEDLRWLAGALSVGAASAAMAITKTVHPPAGATALLAATSDEITQLGWWLLALVLLGSSLMLASALLINNLYKTFPLYWWTPVDLEQLHKNPDEKPVDDIITMDDVEKGVARITNKSRRPSSSTHTAPSSDWQPYKPTPSYQPSQQQQQQQQQQHQPYPQCHPSTSDLTITNTRDDPSPSTNTIHPNDDTSIPLDPAPLRNPSSSSSSSSPTIQITPDTIIVPECIELSGWEREVLEGFRGKLAERERNRKG